MITFHPAARKVANGFIPMVTLRAAKGRMIGSKLSQTGNAFETAEDAKAHALLAALRVAAANPDTMRVHEPANENLCKGCPCPDWCRDFAECDRAFDKRS